ncbi:MAG: hypothetical protein II989_00760 [Bacteroidales bacterium]|nr:hypothetical protein [Bacteroidales bacterium]
MKRLLFAAVLLVMSAVCHAQITPPKQMDTLIVTALKYNHEEVNKKNWPCTIIYKSTTDFRIGDRTYTILDVNRWGKNIHYTVCDSKAPKKETYDLWITTGNLHKVATILFSGYEFYCNATSEGPVEKFYSKPCVVSHTLEGREVDNLEFKEFRCHGEGEVIVIVHVDRSGNVVNAKIMDDLSSSNQCLRFFALRSASLSSFMPSDMAPPVQIGEIVYRFFRKDPAITKNTQLPEDAE